MLSFGSALASQLKNANPVSFWVLKLFHSDEGTSDFIGVSDQDRVDGGDFYHGIVASWGNLNQSLDFYRFETTQANMTVTLINTENSVDGGRFSDLFASNNYINRKWELFQVTTGFSTWDVSANMIGSGVIAGDIKYDVEKITLTLLDNSSRFHKQVPYHSVDSATYSNAPKHNYGSPVPMAYGDFGQNTTLGDFENHFVKSHFPAIVVDKEDSSGYVNALPDTDQGYVDIGGYSRTDRVILNQLHSNNVYMGLKNEYLQCANANVIVGNASAGSDDTPGADGENIVKLKGTSFFGYFDFLSASDAGPISNLNELSDRDFTTVENFGCSSNTITMDLRFPKIPNVGTLLNATRTDIVLHTTSSSAKSGSFSHFKIDTPGTDVNITLTASSAVTQTKAFASDAFTAAQADSLDLQDTDLKISISDSGGVSVAVIAQLGLQVEFVVDQSFSRPVFQREIIYTGEVNDPGGYKIINTEVGTALTGQNLDYVYYAGKGREYGAWVDADDRGSGEDNDNGFAEGALIENPVYIIEDILRNECGLTSTQIDYATFDASGNATNGHIDDTFDEDDVEHIKFSFSNYKFINSRELIDGIAKQCCSYVFLGGDGKFKIKTLRRTDDYGSADKTVDYYDIKLKGISKTLLSQVKNDITINYDFDYQAESFKSSVNTTDATSYGTGTTGSNQTLKLKLDAFGILDTTTATQLADAYKVLFKDQKIVLDFDCLRPYYNDLEMGDIIVFENWDSKIKIYGTAMGTDYYMVSSISKTPFGCSIKAVKVS